MRRFQGASAGLVYLFCSSELRFENIPFLCPPPPLIHPRWRKGIITGVHLAGRWVDNTRKRLMAPEQKLVFSVLNQRNRWPLIWNGLSGCVRAPRVGCTLHTSSNKTYSVVEYGDRGRRTFSATVSERHCLPGSQQWHYVRGRSSLLRAY